MKDQEKTNDYEYINSVSQALVEKVPSSTKVLLYLIFLLLICFFIWAYFANIDQLVRGESKVIPYGQNQIVQNYEGGIITKILVEEGDLVNKGDILLQLKNKQSSSTYEKNILEIDVLKAQKNRLYAEANDEDFIFDEKNDIYQKEFDLYESDISQLDSKLRILKDQISQKEKERNEIRSRIKHLDQNFKLIRQEQKVMDPLVKRGIVSKVEYLKLLREANSIKDELESSKLSLKRVLSSVDEAKNRFKEAKSEFKNNAHKEYNEIIGKINQFSKQNQGLADQVDRTSVVSPVTGYIKKMHINTIGGSVQPGMDLIEIVPKNKKLLIEAKIKPEDIAFLHNEQNVTLKFTAYDFTIYGSLDGTIEKISPDSTTDQENNTYYLVYIRANKDYLGTDAKPLMIMPGMRGSADILTGKKTVLTYLLKPVIKTKQYAFTEN
ncbi:HlyD family type I secretion periplasmic adaptor subunit [Poseidonibacter lekithochrous]|uniref:HlyD family type I secretion periplasmic adaptor subunit n=1 Tax=Poseidonibacter TaxID=2321187 RepID=UPI001C09ED03|nr:MULTISPECIES: HlyD family type I secretion periplasmic adaptor subunit [Poseidonibacter]MBU3014094.1 HlyD family type I secretion periplasmic adaptor subunit [Poseidonibacter lekithochrous]MDO6827392.1 HlyD family type I secretion periplasmic adaptor subunit [Poseidonibacter sp. 1_MG-2023]